MRSEGCAIHTEEIDVLVVGAGPTGLTAANILATAGVRTIAVSRHRGTAHTPRAHITNLRTMEVFRDLGVAESISEVGYPLSWLSNNVLATSLAGMELARFKSYGSGTDRLSEYAAASPAQAVNAPQHVMEPVLLAAARSHGAEVRYAAELVQIEERDGAVHATIRNRDTDQQYGIVAKYVIGADGGRSAVADLLGFEFEGEAGLRNMVSGWLEVDLTEYVEHRPGVMYWIGQPGHEQWYGTATFANVVPWKEWALFHPWSGDGLPSEDFVIERARLAIGVPDIDIKVKSITSWQVNNVVAKEYSRGRIFLAGDAAHRHPPAGGLGLNTSVQDAFNLAWKLIWVLRGKAGTRLLSTYADERRPVGAQVVRRANQNWNSQSAFIEALGFREGQTAEQGWQALEDLFSDAEGASERRVALQGALTTLGYRSNALGIELGQRYESGAVISETHASADSTVDTDLVYEPTTRPGAHLPHAWVEVDCTRTSMIDLVGHGRMTMIVGVGGQAWLDAAEKVCVELGLEYGTDLVGLTVGLRADVDDVTGDWARVREVGDRGAILVRPDRHVAWRSMDEVTDRQNTLSVLLRQVLDL